MSCAATESSDGACTQQYSFIVSSSPQRLLDRYVWLGLALAVLVQLLELWSVRKDRGVVVQTAKEKANASSGRAWASLPASIRLRYIQFATRRFPISTTFFAAGPVLISSIAAWLGLLERKQWVDGILQMMLVWTTFLGIKRVIITI